MCIVYRFVNIPSTDPYVSYIRVFEIKSGFSWSNQATKPSQASRKLLKSKIRTFVLSNFMVAAAAFVQNSFLYIRVFRKETIMAV